MKDMCFLLQHITPELTRLAGGSTFLEISKSAMRSFKVVVPSIDRMKKLEKDLLMLEEVRKDINEKILKTNNLNKSLINQVF